jgi:hypothetical protein
MPFCWRLRSLQQSLLYTCINEQIWLELKESIKYIIGNDKENDLYKWVYMMDQS